MRFVLHNIIRYVKEIVNEMRWRREDAGDEGDRCGTRIAYESPQLFPCSCFVPAVSWAPPLCPAPIKDTPTFILSYLLLLLFFS